jgi:hypothetical protein
MAALEPNAGHTRARARVITRPGHVLVSHFAFLYSLPVTRYQAIPSSSCSATLHAKLPLAIE